MISGAIELDELGLGAQLGEFVRILAEEQEAAGHRIARRVVAADDQKDDIAQIFAGAHVARGLAMGQHRDEVGARLGVDPLVPQLHEIAEALAECRFALLFAFDQAALVGDGGRNVGPVGELAPILERKVEQGRQHLAGELD